MFSSEVLPCTLQLLSETFVPRTPCFWNIRLRRLKWDSYFHSKVIDSMNCSSSERCECFVTFIHENICYLNISGIFVWNITITTEPHWRLKIRKRVNFSEQKYVKFICNKWKHLPFAFCFFFFHSLMLFRCKSDVQKC